MKGVINMTITSKITDSKLKLNLQKSLDEEGGAVLKAKTFSNINTEAIDSDLYDVGETIGSLQELPLVEIYRVNQIQMTKEG